MKLRKMIVAMPIAMIVWVACQKEASVGDNSTTAKLLVEKSEVKTGETLKVRLKDTKQGAVAKWRVTPENGVIIDSVYSKDGNEIQFPNPGTYTVDVEVRNVAANCIPTPQWDTCYRNSPVMAGLSTTVTVKN